MELHLSYVKCQFMIVDHLSNIMKIMKGSRFCSL